LVDGGVLDWSSVPVQRGSLVSHLDIVLIVFIAMHNIVDWLDGFLRRPTYSYGMNAVGVKCEIKRQKRFFYWKTVQLQHPFLGG